MVTEGYMKGFEYDRNNNYLYDIEDIEFNGNVNY